VRGGNPLSHCGPEPHGGDICHGTKLSRVGPAV
jgi:hypothetical protein